MNEKKTYTIEEIEAAFDDCFERCTEDIRREMSNFLKGTGKYTLEDINTAALMTKSICDIKRDILGQLKTK